MLHGFRINTSAGDTANHKFRTPFQMVCSEGFSQRAKGCKNTVKLNVVHQKSLNNKIIKNSEHVYA